MNKNKIRQVVMPRKGLKYLGETGYPGMEYGIGSKPINKMEDWKGLKMRAGGYQELCIEAWGLQGS